MNPSIHPVASIQGRIRLPASKSYSIRAFFVAACGGKSTIKYPSDCDDAMVAMRLAKDLGATVKSTATGHHVDASSLNAIATTFDVGESGTSLRFLLPLLSCVGQKSRVIGHGTLIGRPNKHLCESLRAAGMDISGTLLNESVPIAYRGGVISTPVIDIDGSVSSQFISALLIALPRLDHDTTIKVNGKLVSEDYIVMTLQILAEAGIKIKKINDRTYQVKGNQSFKGLANFTVPSDYGLAAFSLACAALLPSKVILDGYYNDKFVQADGHILPLLKQLGVKFTKGKESIVIQGPFQLKGGKFSLKDCPDLVPIMTVLAMFAKGPTTLTGIAHARVKESDRIGDLSNELKKVGAKFKITDDSMTIMPQAEYRVGELLNSHRDHRLAMAFTVLGAKIGCRINDLTCTHKSYPAFVNDMKKLGLKIINN